MRWVCAILYCHTWCPAVYHILLHHLISDMIFGKMSSNIKCVFWFSLQVLSETFLILRRTERDIITNVYRSSCKVPDILVRFQRNLNFLDGLSKTYSNIEFHENPSNGSIVVSCWRIDMTKPIAAFRNFANAPYNNNSVEWKHSMFFVW
jgi:hypothetical protein